MSRLGALAGLGRTASQTPVEYAHALGAAVPALATESRLVATRFSVARYGAPTTVTGESEDLADAWRTIRRALAGRTLRRLVPGKGSA